MLVCLHSHNYSSCDHALAIVRFHVSYGSGTHCCSEMCNLSAVTLPVITFQRFPTLTTSVQTRCSALVLRLIKFQRYPTKGYEIVCFHFWLDALKLQTQTLEIKSLKCMWRLYSFRGVGRILQHGGSWLQDVPYTSKIKNYMSQKRSVVEDVLYYRCVLLR